MNHSIFWRRSSEQLSDHRSPQHFEIHEGLTGPQSGSVTGEGAITNESGKTLLTGKHKGESVLEKQKSHGLVGGWMHVPLFRKIGLFAAVATLMQFVPLAAQTQYPESMPLNGGTLSWTATYSSGVCGYHGNGNYTMYEYSNFVYSYSYPSSFNAGETFSVSVNLVGAVGYIQSATQAPPFCPAVGPLSNGPYPLLGPTNFYRVAFTPTGDGVGSASMEAFNMGGVAPQFIVLSVIYAPPGPGGTSAKSYVDYSGTTELGTNTTLSSAFTNESSYTTTASLLGVSVGGGAGYTQETDDSTSISVNQTNTQSNSYPGLEPANVVGLDHDNDIILLWINPALECVDEAAWTVVAIPAQAQCLIFDPEMAPGDADDPLMDVEELPVGELNGDYSLQALNPDIYQILLNHGITPAAYPTIVAADPYYSCGASISCVQQTIGVNSTRFDLVTQVNPAISFINGGSTRGYVATYAGTSVKGQGASTSYTVTNTLNGSENFLGIITELLKSTQTWTNKWSEATTTMTGKSATINITPPLSGYTGPSQFAVYKDNVYGTFMIYPTE